MANNTRKPEETAAELLGLMPNGNARIYCVNKMHNSPTYYESYWKEVIEVLDKKHPEIQKGEKVYTLANGMIIRDNRHVHIPITIENQHTKYMQLSWMSDQGFYINMYSCSINLQNWPQFYNELDQMRLALVEANMVIK